MRRFWECLAQAWNRGRTGTQSSNLQLFWDPWHNGCHQKIINASSIFLFTQIYAMICFDLPPFPQCLSWGKGAVVCILLPQRAKVDAAVMLAEKTVLPQTFHPSDELAAQWKGIEPEIAFSQPQISSVPISVKQGLLARYILGLSLYLGFLDFPQASTQISVGR